ncbi:Unknown protein sequence [Pseudomonas amygdali pv. lachrymans]|uniref:Uncharacterized protein n=1 Tax=Pseudomonas amygdali pv. lachrymans TaxID=53707 RepID=A0ABR5KSK4_PSEAV|nr:Unknown protein sequence [Pseudomonas amygdali pv. lachrymans]
MNERLVARRQVLRRSLPAENNVRFNKWPVAQLVVQFGLQDVEQAVTLVALGVIRAFGAVLSVDVPVPIIRSQLPSPILELDDKDAIVSYHDQVEFHSPLGVTDQHGGIGVPGISQLSLHSRNCLCFASVEAFAPDNNLHALPLASAYPLIRAPHKLPGIDKTHCLVLQFRLSRNSAEPG